MEYLISRYDEKSDSLFICINSKNNPVYLEHFFTSDEMKDEKSRTATIEKLVAELELMDEAYVEPEVWVSKTEEAQALKVNIANIATAKTAIIANREKLN